jgi:hypothetical protein
MAKAQSGKAASDVISLQPGPQLFIDDFLIEQRTGVTRTVHHPFKTGIPIITGGSGGDSCFQPYLSVLHDPVTKSFRMWYGVPQSASQTHIAYLESHDGRNWRRPHRLLADPFPMNFRISVLDRGTDAAPAGNRFVFASYYDDGMMIATSTDGLSWKAIWPAAVLKHNHDINSIHWDPLRHRFIAIASVMMEGSYWKGQRRIPHQSVSTDLRNWEQPWPILFPKRGVPIEEGETEFYSMSGILCRGGLLIGLVKILRDDLNATPGASAKAMGDSARKAAGIGYTVLAWSRDGRTWHRDHEPFLLNNPLPGSWDHAMAWGDAQLLVGDSTYIYYGGYARGHKVARFEERQIGLAVLRRDRYVSLDADNNEARIVTKPIKSAGTSLLLNARIIGSLEVRVLDEDGTPRSEFGPISLSGDSTIHVVKWARPLSLLGNRAIKLEFRFTDTQLFGFEFR